MFRIHIHDFTLWERGFKHSWKHYIEAERHCKKCNYKEYQLLEIFCPTYKRTGNWCFSCAPYAKIWEKHFDNVEIVCNNIGMKKRGRPILTERNAEMLAKKRGGYTLRMLMQEYDLKKSTVSEVLKRTIELEAKVKQV